MLLKDYVEGLTKLLNDDPEYGELEVWNFTDDEGNSIRPCDGCITEGYVNKEEGWDTDDYKIKAYLDQYLDEYEIEMDEFLLDNKPIILI